VQANDTADTSCAAVRANSACSSCPRSTAHCESSSPSLNSFGYYTAAELGISPIAVQHGVLPSTSSYLWDEVGEVFSEPHDPFTEQYQTCGAEQTVYDGLHLLPEIAIDDVLSTLPMISSYWGTSCTQASYSTPVDDFSVGESYWFMTLAIH
jgi:hypothetical protein